MFNKSNFCHIASNNRNEQKGSVFIYKTSDTLAQVTQSGYFNEKLIDINVHDLIIHVQYDPVARTLKKSVLIVTERTMDNVETAPILDQTIGDDIDQLGDQVQGIEEKIPENASAQNQLATKNQITDLQNSKQNKGDYATNTALSQGLSQKQDIATAVNYDNITNCITEIPQNIKLELADGVVTIKTGSKIRIPKTGNVFEDYVFTSDTTRTGGVNGSAFLVALFNVSNNQFAQTFTVTVSKACSGTTDTLAGTPQHLWYDTTNNIIKYYGNDGVTNNYYAALPLAIVSGASTITSIDQVFNGFGYIGSTVFVLPGVKGLIPNGRNEDGTLKNINANSYNLYKYTRTTASPNLALTMAGGGYLEPSSVITYDAEKNIHTISGTPSQKIVVGRITFGDGGQITSFEPKPAFHAVDYSDFEELDNSVVHKTGNENIDGVKTFNNTIRSKGSAITFEGISTSATQSFKDFDAYDDTGKAVGTIRVERNTTYGQSVNLISRKSDGSAGANLVVRTSPDGKYSLFTSAVPASSSNDTSLATTAWVRDLFETLYPVGSLYISTGNSCPLTSIVKKSDGSNSQWDLVAAGKALWTGNGTTGDGTVRNTPITGANNTISAGAPNITGQFVAANSNAASGSGAFNVVSTTDGKGWDGTSAMRSTYGFDASRSSSIYGNSTTVQPPAYVVNVWRRTA